MPERSVRLSWLDGTNGDDEDDPFAAPHAHPKKSSGGVSIPTTANNNNSCKSFRRHDGSSGRHVLNYLQRRGSEVQELMVCEVESFTDEQVKEMETLLVEHHKAIHLKRLELPQNGLTDAAGEALARILCVQHETLTALNVAHNPLTHLGLSPLVGPLSTTVDPPSKVVHLDLTDTQLGRKGATLVATLLRDNACLRDLRLGRNKLGPNGIKTMVEGLTTHPALKRLDISFNGIKSKGATFLAKALMDSPSSRLRHIDISCNEIGAPGGRILAEMLTLDRRLTSLHCGTNGLGPEGAAYFAQALSYNYTLKELSIEENGIGQDGASLLVESLTRDENSTTSSSALERLNLAWNEIGEGGAADLAKVLKTNAVLTNVDLTGNKIGSVGVVRLAEALSENLSLSRLILTDNQIDNCGAFALAGALGRPTCTLDLCNVEWKENPIAEEGLASLARVVQLRRNRQHWLDELVRELCRGTVQSVNLSNRAVGDEEVLLIAKAMNESTHPLRIRSLWLGGGLLKPRSLVPLVQACVPSPSLVMRLYLKNCCHMGEESVEAIANCLAQSDSLEVLCLTGCGVTSQGSAQIAKALATNQSLRRINFDRNQIGDFGLTSLADMLPHKTLTSISANDNGITDVSMQSKGLTHIQELHLKKNAITDIGALAFAGCLAAVGNVKITWISLQHNKVTKKGADTIRSFMPEIVPGAAIVDY